MSSTVPSAVICVCKFETKPVTVVLHKRVAPLVSAGSLHSWVSPHADSKDLLERERGEKRKKRERVPSIYSHPYNEREKRGRGERRKREGRRRETGRYLVVW